MKTPMNCDWKTRTCGDASEGDISVFQLPKEKIDFYYFTDPLCSHCWALDSVLTRFKLEYKEYLNVITVMGGMTEDGNHYEDLKGPEAKEQASHWEQVGLFYHVPINAKIWMKDPITSSFPASIAYLLIKKQDENLATKFMRMVREGAFVFEKNIAKRSVLESMIQSLGLNSKTILDVAFSPEGKKILVENFQPMIELGVSGFPTVVMVNNQFAGIKVIGSRTMETYKKALLKVMKEGSVLEPAPLPPLNKFIEMVPTVFFHEIEKIYDLKAEEVKPYVVAHLEKGTYEFKEVAKHRFVRKI